MKKKYFVTEELDETIILLSDGGDCDGRVWCVGVDKKDVYHRMRDYDGFYNLSDLKLLDK